ncbi:ABC transporter ATP-binding protein [Waterburya agarophytonicola K14]|uniref:ABC transporter ATP-binding protein n=1 Tax=Waterburya agarophytonicola KI4 TaxID=2874699 RepID=A0A964BQI7_9CYAN|nr:ABC transporter ATP-binding protein [Waterburya agarophytonicola]MCC0177753.1 ABC transporter ATP-binding protein [Waterburya agarophytonicola KI4]
MFKNSTNNFLFDLIKSKPIYFVASLILSLVGIILNILGTILLISILVIALNNGDNIAIAHFTSLLKYLFFLADFFFSSDRLVISLCLIAVIFFLEKIINYINAIVNIKHTNHLVYQMKRKGIALLCKLDLNYYTQNKTGDILFKINREIDKTALGIKSIQTILITGGTILILAVVLASISWSLTAITLVLIVILFIVNHFFVNQSKQQGVLLAHKYQVYNRKLVDFLTGINLIKNAANEEQEYQQIINLVEDKNRTELRSRSTLLLANSINKINQIAIILTLVISGYYLYDRHIQSIIPILLIYLAVLLKLPSAINQLNNARNQFKNNQLSIEIVAKFLREKEKSIIQSGNITFTKLKTSIELDNVTFAYPYHGRIILDKINLSIPQGKTMTLVGFTGAGKSTLVSLLSRINEPIEGTITINNKDIKEYTLSSLRKSIATIDGEPFLFNNSLLYNLTYGLENITESQAIAATKMIDPDDFIAKLPQGIYTEIDDRTIIISEFQKQLIAIARALLLKPEIVILDEPLKKLNKEEGEIVQNALDKLCRDRTTIVITNKLNIIKKSDLIVILNKGKIIESGTHQELLKNGNFYQRMCSTQFKSSQQSHQQKLAKKIAQKLARQTNNNLSYEIHNNLNYLLNYLQLVNDVAIDDDGEQEKILDESYQSAKNMLASLREYERKISRGFKQND